MAALSRLSRRPWPRGALAISRNERANYPTRKRNKRRLQYYSVGAILFLFGMIYKRWIGSTNDTTEHQPVPHGSQKLYYATSGLGQLAKQYLEAHNYRETKDEAKAAISWRRMWDDSDPIVWEKIKPWQRINHVPDEGFFNSKGKFLLGIQRYMERTGKDAWETPWFLPESFRLYDRHDRQSFRDRLSENGGGMDVPWILKKVNKDRGEGITLLGPKSEGLIDLRQKLQNDEKIIGKSDFYVVQRYMTNPLLVEDDYKFDLRIYWLVASAKPLVVLYHDGILRVSLTKYDGSDFSNRKGHLTNVSQQKGEKDYEANKDKATRSFGEFLDTLENHVSKYPNIPKVIGDDPLGYIRKQIKDALVYIVEAFKDSFALGKCNGDNAFALFGGDFMVDKNLRVWVTEVQSGPDMALSAASKKDVFKVLLPEMFDIVTEVQNKQIRGESLFPLQSAKTWEHVYSDE